MSGSEILYVASIVNAVVGIITVTLIGFFAYKLYKHFFKEG